MSFFFSPSKKKMWCNFKFESVVCSFGLEIWLHSGWPLDNMNKGIVYIGWCWWLWINNLCYLSKCQILLYDWSLYTLNYALLRIAIMLFAATNGHSHWRVYLVSLLAMCIHFRVTLARPLRKFFFLGGAFLLLPCLLIFVSLSKVIFSGLLLWWSWIGTSF